MDKQKIDKLVNKVKKAKKLMDEVDAEIRTCNRLDYWQISGEDKFKETCKALGVEYDGQYSQKHEVTFYKAFYKGLEIVGVSD